MRGTVPGKDDIKKKTRFKKKTKAKKDGHVLDVQLKCRLVGHTCFEGVNV